MKNEGYATNYPSKEMKMEKGKASHKDLKPDALKHEGKNVFKGEKYCMPGQQYVPKKDHNESDFAGEQKQKSMY